MQSVHTRLWDLSPPFKHASPLPAPPPSNVRNPYVTPGPPAKRITFYKSGDNQFGGVRMAIHKRSFKCFDALLDDLSQKVPLPFGVRTVTTPRGTHAITHLEQLQDGACYLCSDRRQAKPVNMELASKGHGAWYHHGRKPQRADSASATPPGHLHAPYRQRRVLLVKNSEPGMRRSVVLSRRSTRSLRAFLDEASELMQFHVRKLYTAEGRRIDSVQSLMTCPGVLVCVGREAFSPLLINYIRKTSEEKLPGLSTKSPGLGPRIPGNGARSPVTQGVRSPPHGAQSRASEYDEAHESRRNVNFGLETKKSIIHPRSDSSNRSARLSLSSEKSYGVCSQTKPAVLNDDIEKRVFVNKDGSVSVEMRVRFRLQHDETLQWSTQIKKSPSLTNDHNDCCPLSQVQPEYLQPGHSESCSEPDSPSFDGVDYSSQPLQGPPEQNRCSYCYQRQESKFDLWENPSHKHVPAPPAHSYTMMRHTQSSSSSSSCNSRRVVRCRAQLSRSPGGSGSDKNQVVQKETCVTEQVAHTVEREQDGDTQLEVCKVSRCCSRTEVVAIDTEVRPPSGKSVDGELMVEEDNRPFSTVSSSSHVLQSLKEDPDDEEDDLPPSVSQCSHRDQPSSSPTPATPPHEEPKSNVSIKTVHSLKHGQRDETESPSGAAVPHSIPIHSPENPSEHVCAEVGPIKSVVSSLFEQTRFSPSSQKSYVSDVCPKCGGCKSEVSSNSRTSHCVTSKPTSPFQNNEASDQESKDEQRAPSMTSAASHKSKASYRSDVVPDEATNSSSSAPSAPSVESKCMSRDLAKNPGTEPEEKTAKRTASSLSNTSGASVNSHKSNRVPGTTELSPADGRHIREADGNQRTPSSLSVRSNASAKSGMAESVLSAKSTKSKVSAKSGSSHRSICSNCAKAASPGCKEEAEYTEDVIEKGEDKEAEVEERSQSIMSAKSNQSAKTSRSHISTKASENPLTPESETGTIAEERSTSQISGRLSVKSTESCQCKAKEKVLQEEKSDEGQVCVLEVETQTSAESAKSVTLEAIRSASAASGQSAPSEKSHHTDGELKHNQDRSPSATSVGSRTSVQTSKSKRSNHAEEALDLTPEADTGKQDNAEDAMSVKSKPSVRSASCSLRNVSSPNLLAINSPEGSDKVEIDRIYTPKPPASPRSPAGLLLPSAVEQRGPSALSAHSSTSGKVARSRCSCGSGSALHKEKKEKKIDRETDQCSERASSFLSTSSRRPRKGSEGTEQALSRKSSGSTSLGLPEDQETAGSDSGKSSISCHSSDRRNASQPPAVNIPAIETPRQDGTASSATAQSKSSRQSNSSVKTTPRANGGSVGRSNEDVSVGNETESVKDIPQNRASSPMSESVKEENRKSPSRASKKSSKNKGSSRCSLRPESKASRQSEGNPESVNSAGQVKGPKSPEGSECGQSEVRETAVKSQSPRCLHTPRGCNQCDEGSESTLSHSLSAADLLKETVVAGCQQSRQSKASRRSGRPRSESGLSQRNQTEQEDTVQLTPECLPNASPSEVINDWLRSIPANSSMLEPGDGLNEDEVTQTIPETEEVSGEKLETDKATAEEEKMDEEEPTVHEFEKKDQTQCDEADPTKVGTSSRSKNWQYSAAVMKVLLSSSSGRCRSMPEVSPVYGRRLSTSARGLLDCLAQLQLIEPAVGHQVEPQSQQYDQIMTILQSLWLTEPGDVKGKETKGGAPQQVTPPRSSSGVGMSSGSGGSGKSNGNQADDETPAKDTVSLQEEEPARHAAEEENAPKDVQSEVESERAEEPTQSEEQSTAPLESPKSSANDSSKSPTDNERDTQDGSCPGSHRPSLSRRLSQDPDPMWVLHLLKKLEKQFISHYVDAMSEFKVRWDLDDSLILDTMICELKDEVSRRIQSSIQREMKKIQGRAGKAGRPPRPPQLANISRDSTMTERRRRMMKVMKNQSVKTADSLSDEETAGDVSDQRSDDEYCPCDACVRKKMAARPLKRNPLAAEAPVMMEFDLRRILELKKSPMPVSTRAPPPAEADAERLDEDGRNLEVVEEEEEEEETKEDIKAEVVLEQTIPEEEEEEGSFEQNDWTDDEGEHRRQSAKGGEGDEDEEEATNDCTQEEEEEGGAASGEEEEDGSDKDTVKEVTAGQEGSVDSEKGGAHQEPAHMEAEDEDGSDDVTGEEEPGDSGASEEERVSMQSRGAAPAVCGTEGEEADAEDSDDSGRPGATTGQEGRGGDGEEAELLHQVTRTSVESQPGSMEDGAEDLASKPLR